ncbi:MAG: histidine kinase [Allomuricauda sp.]
MTRYLSRKRSYTVFFIINLVMAVIRLGIYPNQTITFHIVIFIAAYGLFILAWEMLLLIHNYFEKLFPVESMPTKRIVIQILLTTILFTILSKALFGFASYVFGIEISDLLDKVIYLLNFLVAVIFNVTLFGTQYFYQWQRDLISKTNLEKEQAVVKYDALRNQLNPHFLFNALTSLNSLIFENQQLASDFLQQLSKVYRYMLQNKDITTVSLQTELNFIAHYIFLLKTRFEDAIEVVIHVADDDLDKGVVPAMTQVLLENAIKHNVISIDQPLKISIASNGDYLIVENNIIRKKNVETSNKQGMENVRSLYNYLSDKPVEIIDTETTFTVKIPLI